MLEIPIYLTFLGLTASRTVLVGNSPEVEAVAVRTWLFRGHRVSAKKDEGESDKDVRKRVDSGTNDVNMEMLLRMRDADGIQLEYREASTN